MEWKIKGKKKLPAPITILMMVIVLAAIGTWLIPAGQYSKLTVDDAGLFSMATKNGSLALPLSQQTLDSLGIQIALEKFEKGDIRKPVSIPGTYYATDAQPQGFLAVLSAPIKGIYDSIDIILLVLIIGGFVFVFNETGALVRGVGFIAHFMKGREPLLIAILTTVFSFLGSSYGMAEESIVFYPLLVPLFLAAGYDRMVPFAIIFGGCTIGYISSFSNPFSTVIASNVAGFNWLDGLYERLAVFALTTSFFVWYLLRYAARVRLDPASSIALRVDGNVALPYPVEMSDADHLKTIDLKTWILLAIYFFTFVTMIVGVILYDWWTLEMTTLFLGAAVLAAFISRIKEKTFITEFIKGAESLLSVAFIIGVARGVTVIMNDGLISDTILFYAAQVTEGVHPAWFILLLFLFYFLFSFFISSTSGMAVLTMPIMGALAIMMHIPGREVVNAYIFGMGIMQILAPTGLVLPMLAMVNMSFKAWVQFIRPVMLVIIIICAITLLMGIQY
jgi:uncharacterized ion transporter superfamily protein YfcC